VLQQLFCEPDVTTGGQQLAVCADEHGIRIVVPALQQNITPAYAVQSSKEKDEMIEHLYAKCRRLLRELEMRGEDV
jgi:hypothetical protein